MVWGRQPEWQAMVWGGKEKMKLRNMKTGWNLSGLQLFAEGDGGSEGGSEGEGSGEGSGSEGGSEPMSFDDFLALEGNQAEFDKRINKAVTTAVTNAQSKWQALTDNKLTEAEKLAKMTKEERQNYELEQLKKKLADYEKAGARTELARTAREMLVQENVNIPDKLLSNLVTDEADSTKESVEAFIKLYKEAVQSAVKDMLKGQTPKKKTNDTQMTKEQIMAVKNAKERQRLIAENIDLFR
jgi:hypothetical protein